MHIHISSNAIRKNAGSWGDTRFAQNLGKALDNRGVSWSIFFRGEQPELTGCDDIVLRTIGRHVEEPVAGVPNLLWFISPPSFVTRARLERYQGLYCCSSSVSERYTDMGLPMYLLPQATDTSTFHPNKSVEAFRGIPITFVGGLGERAPRRIVFDTIRMGFDVHVWGPGWDGLIPPENYKGDHLDFDELTQVYAASRVVLNSHMPDMASFGMMSNRTFDAIAAGALVISDNVQGFQAGSLPELTMVNDQTELKTALETALHGPPPSFEERLQRNQRIVKHYSFDSRADTLIKAAQHLLKIGKIAPHETELGQTFDLSDIEHLSSLRVSSASQGAEMIKASRELLRLEEAFERSSPDDNHSTLEPAEDSLIHPMLFDLRRAKQLARGPRNSETRALLHNLTLRARRLVEALCEPFHQFGLPALGLDRHAFLNRISNDEVLFPNAPEEYSRNALKAHVQLWPRRNPVIVDKPIGVFLHLFYEDLAAIFAENLVKIDAPFQIYISTDTDEKAKKIRAVFETAEIRVLPNRGRDIYPKFYGLADVYGRHDLVLHLHGKRSGHNEVLDAWLDHCLSCLLPSTGEVNRILSLFQSIPRLGVVAPLTFRKVLGAAHWGQNYEIAHELAARIGLDPSLLENPNQRFPVGSMFWARTAALKPLIDLNLAPENFPKEAGQVDGTVAHALERMVGVVCKSHVLELLYTAGKENKSHQKYKLRFSNNGEVRKAIESGTALGENVG